MITDENHAYLFFFFSHKGILCFKFIIQGQRVNKHYYLDVLTMRRNANRKKHSGF